MNLSKKHIREVVLENITLRLTTVDNTSEITLEIIEGNDLDIDHLWLYFPDKEKLETMIKELQNLLL